MLLWGLQEVPWYLQNCKLTVQIENTLFFVDLDHLVMKASFILCLCFFYRPTLVKVDRVISMSDLIQLLPSSVFENYFLGEGMFSNVRKKISFSSKSKWIGASLGVYVFIYFAVF